MSWRLALWKVMSSCQYADPQQDRNVITVSILSHTPTTGMCCSHGQANKHTQSQLVSMKTQDIGHIRQQSQAEAKVRATQFNAYMDRIHLLLALKVSLMTFAHQQVTLESSCTFPHPGRALYTQSMQAKNKAIYGPSGALPLMQLEKAAGSTCLVSAGSSSPLHRLLMAVLSL